jgi:hypothetical protein
LHGFDAALFFCSRRLQRGFEFGSSFLFWCWLWRGRVSVLLVRLYFSKSSRAVRSRQPSRPLYRKFSSRQRNKVVQQFFERNQLGAKPASAPVLVLTSESVQGVPKALNAAAVARMCKQRDRVQSYEYRDAELGVLGDSVKDQIARIQDRFAGKAPPSNCR